MIYKTKQKNTTGYWMTYTTEVHSIALDDLQNKQKTYTINKTTFLRQHF